MPGAGLHAQGGLPGLGDGFSSQAVDGLDRDPDDTDDYMSFMRSIPKDITQESERKSATNKYNTIKAYIHILVKLVGKDYDYGMS